jgi:hypothetical protein
VSSGEEGLFFRENRPLAAFLDSPAAAAGQGDRDAQSSRRGLSPGESLLRKITFLDGTELPSRKDASP